MLRNYVRAPARDLGQALRQGRALAEEVRAPREVDEEVYVAVGAFLAASDATSHELDVPAGGDQRECQDDFDLDAVLGKIRP